MINKNSIYGFTKANVNSAIHEFNMLDFSESELRGIIDTHAPEPDQANKIIAEGARLAIAINKTHRF